MNAGSSEQPMQQEKRRVGSRVQRSTAVVLALLFVLAGCDFEEEIQTDGPSLWFRFDEQAAPFTDVVEGRTASLAGDQPELIVPRQPSASAGGDAWAVAKTAPGDARLSLPAPPGVDALAADGGVSIEAWVTGQVVSETQTILRRGSGASSDWTLSQHGGEYRFEVYDDTGVVRWTATGGTVRPGVGQQIVATFSDDGSSGVATLWIDGAEAASTGSVAGAPRAEAPAEVRMLEGGPITLDELIVFDDEVLSGGRVLAHHVAGTTVDECDQELAPKAVADTPVTVLDTAAGIGATAIAPAAPVEVSVGGVAGVSAADLEMVELVVTVAANAQVTIWPTGQARPDVPSLALHAGTPGTVVVPVGAGTGLSIASDESIDLRVEATAAWTGGELRPASGLASVGIIPAGGRATATLGPQVPEGATAVLLGVSANTAAPATLTFPATIDPELGTTIELDLAVGTSTSVVLAGVDDGETTIASSHAAVVIAQVLGWVVNPACAMEETIPPLLDITSPANGTAIDAEHFFFQVEGTVSDEGSGVAAIDVAVDGVATAMVVDLSGAPGTWSSDVALPEGAHTLTFTARDFAGNVTSEDLAVTVTLPGPDEVVPAPSLLVPDQAELASVLVSYDATAMHLVLSGLPGTLSTIRPGSTIAADSVPPLLPDGLFNKVDRIQRVGDQWHLMLTPGVLEDSFYQLSVDEQVSIAPPADPAGSGEGMAGPMASVDIPWTFPKLDVCRGVDSPPEWIPGDPSTKICAGMQGGGNLNFDFGLEIGFEPTPFPRPVLRHARAIATADASFDGYVQGTAATRWDHTFDLFKLPVSARPRIPIGGPIPIYLQPNLKIELVLDVQLQAAVRVDVTGLGGMIQAGLTYDDGELKGVGDADFTPPTIDFADGSLSVNLGGSIKAGPKVGIDLLVNGQGGGEIWARPLDVQLGATLDAANHELHLTGALVGQMGANLKIEGAFGWKGWTSGAVTRDLYNPVMFFEEHIDLETSCTVGECGSKVLPVYGQESSVADISDDGIAVGSGRDEEHPAVPLMWDASASSPVAQELSRGLFPQGKASQISPDGDHAAGFLGFEGEPYIARWDLQTGGVPAYHSGVVGDPWYVCDVTDNGTVLYIEYSRMTTPTHQLVRWAVGGQPEPLGIESTSALRRNPCTAQLLSDGTVIWNADGGQYGPLIGAWPQGGTATLLGAGEFRSVAAEGGKVVGSQSTIAAPFGRAVVWDVDQPGLVVALSNDHSIAEGMDDDGNVYGVVLTDDGARNAIWRPTGSGYAQELFGEAIGVWSVTSSGHVFGLTGPEDLGVQLPNVAQWHDEWFVKSLGPGRLGTIFGSQSGVDDASRTVYFGGGGEAWHKPVDLNMCVFGPWFPFVGAAWVSTPCL